jgi:hypothetical protein
MTASLEKELEQIRMEQNHAPYILWTGVWLASMLGSINVLLSDRAAKSGQIIYALMIMVMLFSFYKLIDISSKQVRLFNYAAEKHGPSDSFSIELRNLRVNRHRERGTFVRCLLKEDGSKQYPSTSLVLLGHAAVAWFLWDQASSFALLSAIIIGSLFLIFTEDIWVKKIEELMTTIYRSVL